MRERTIKVADGGVLFFGPWPGSKHHRFGMRLRAPDTPHQVTMTATQARKLAAELIRRADQQDSFLARSGGSPPESRP